MAGPDLLQSIRASIIADAGIIAELPAYAGGYPVFTRRPVPDDAPMPCIVVGASIAGAATDGIADQRPVVIHDIAVYGRNGAVGTTDHHRAVERIARAIQQLFHRRPASVSSTGWDVINVAAVGPHPAPVDDEQIVGRRVEITARLARAGN